MFIKALCRPCLVTVPILGCKSRMIAGATSEQAGAGHLGVGAQTQQRELLAVAKSGGHTLPAASHMCLPPVFTMV